MKKMKSNEEAQGKIEIPGGGENLNTPVKMPGYIEFQPGDPVPVPQLPPSRGMYALTEDLTARTIKAEKLIAELKNRAIQADVDLVNMETSLYENIKTLRNNTAKDYMDMIDAVTSILNGEH